MLIACVDATGTYGLKGSIKRYAERDELEFSDACAILGTTEAETAECRQFADGALTRGVHSGFELFLRLARSLKDQLTRTPDFSVAVANSTLTSENMMKMREMATNWLNKGVDTATLLYDEELRELNAEFQRTRAISIGVFFAMLAVLLVALYEPLVRSLDQEFKKVRSILIMVPFAWLEDIKELADLVKQQA